MNPRPATLVTDAAFAEKVLRIASEQGWTVDAMQSFVGFSIAFEKDGRRIAGDIQRTREQAVVNACKRLLPEIYEHL